MGSSRSSKVKTPPRAQAFRQVNPLYKMQQNTGKHAIANSRDRVGMKGGPEQALGGSPADQMDYTPAPIARPRQGDATKFTPEKALGSRADQAQMMPYKPQGGNDFKSMDMPKDQNKSYMAPVGRATGGLGSYRR